MRKMLGRILVDQGIITEDQLVKALMEMTESHLDSKRLIGDVIIDLGLASKDQINAALAEQRLSETA